ncbi:MULTISPECIES: hypothetical protein [unclassified Variovorax]|uniref:hypothetical protein n=1 Tax=unclassified Variovorax TaxID=663243 RepID=UPI0008398E65|nr:MULTISPECIES: hypothetical protein [unclassified Variovorax]PNG58506.1 hypothetical protein CHC07_00231 [Variovorax sp. B4]PNG61704.1 hypothetical protein CHC06_01605 [Variovorax sp. B2]VTV12244.1 hypothetical protein WDL1CHR_03060 [Variovorax sp. WDL1]
MHPIVQTALRSLQGLAYARVVEQCRRVAWLSRTLAGAARLEERARSVAAWENQLTMLRLAMTAEERVELKIKRAIYLRMLLDSAPVRLQPWVDEDDLADMPASHLFEWVAYDLERLELDEIEATLTEREEARYLRESVEFKGFE